MQTVYKYKIIFFYSFKGNNIETPWNNPTRLDLPRVIPYHQARSLTIISPRPVRHEFNQKKEKNNKISLAQFPEKRQSGQIARVSSRFNGQRKDRKVEKLHSSRPPVESVHVQPPTNWDHRGKFRLGDARWGEARWDTTLFRLQSIPLLGPRGSMTLRFQGRPRLIWIRRSATNPSGKKEEGGRKEQTDWLAKR